MRYNIRIMGMGSGTALAIEACKNFIISGVLNGLCAWRIHRNAHAVLFDFWNLFVDTTIICFLVSICTAFFSTASAKRNRRQGISLLFEKKWQNLLKEIPAASLPAGCCLFGMCMPVLLLIFGLSFRMIEKDTLTVIQFIVFKGVWGGMYGAFICLVILFRHLKEEEHV